jgi:RNA-directed DNA polymerase
MEERMKEPYIEGVATHDGPESCAGFREEVGEALTGVRIGWDIEPRNHIDWGADAVDEGGRQHKLARYRKLQTDPARSKTLCMCRTSMRENREIPGFPVSDGEAGRCGKAKAVIRR